MVEKRSPSSTRSRRLHQDRVHSTKDCDLLTPSTELSLVIIESWWRSKKWSTMLNDLRNITRPDNLDTTTCAWSKTSNFRWFCEVNPRNHLPSLSHEKSLHEILYHTKTVILFLATASVEWLFVHHVSSDEYKKLLPREVDCKLHKYRTSHMVLLQNFSNPFYLQKYNRCRSIRLTLKI